jgi:hypothetical protein
VAQFEPWTFAKQLFKGKAHQMNVMIDLSFDDMGMML